ncbi:MAG: 50S ribosomal protein L17 [Planctomycetota bacterium]
MRHRHDGFKLSRDHEHRMAMFRNMSMALIRHESIITTLPKAKALKPFFERLVTLARKGDLHSRRLAASKLGPSADAEVVPGDGSDADHRSVLQKLFQDIGPRFKTRDGGYTRIIKRHQRRLGDAGVTAHIELLKDGEIKIKKETAPAPAPQVKVESPAEAPAETKSEA